MIFKSSSVTLNDLKAYTPNSCPATSLPLYLRLQLNNHNNAIKMEVLLGITGKDFTLIACSKAAMRGATVLKASDDKTRPLNKHTLMAFSGEAGDTNVQDGERWIWSLCYPSSTWGG
ncbi:hypothetical protein WAI453_002370 [Rhynchosporium graminicola]